MIWDAYHYTWWSMIQLIFEKQFSMWLLVVDWAICKDYYGKQRKNPHMFTINARNWWNCYFKPNTYFVNIGRLLFIILLYIFQPRWARKSKFKWSKLLLFSFAILTCFLKKLTFQEVLRCLRIIWNDMMIPKLLEK